LLLTAFSVWGAYNAGRLRAAGGSHHVALYLQTMVFEWLMTAYVAWGVRRHGAPLSAVFGERWRSGSALLFDIGIAGGFWFVSLIALGLVAHAMRVVNQRESVRFLLPHGAVEIALWVLLAATAGICEEALFRGYLQRQLAAWTGSLAAAVALSAILFGAGHIYQGLGGAAVIAVYGAMFGVLAAWRGSVRPGMMAHAWQDTLSGLLGGLLQR
jgi:membrane protease YdiL (CAAX protease family)